MDIRTYSNDDAVWEALDKKLTDHNEPFFGTPEKLTFLTDGAGANVFAFHDCFYIDTLYVDEASRGQGLGSAVMRSVEEYARQRGLKEIFLATYDFQAPWFYPKLGYAEMARSERHLHGFTLYYFKKEL